MCADMALAVDQILLGVQTGCDIDCGKLQAPSAKVRRVLAHGDGVLIHNAVDAVVIILQFHKIAQSPDVIAQGQRTGRLDTRKNDLFLFRCRLLHFRHDTFPPTHLTHMTHWFQGRRNKKSTFPFLGTVCLRCHPN